MDNKDSNNLIEHSHDGDLDIRKKIEDLRKIAQKNGFDNANTTSIEDCLNVLLRNNPDVCEALRDLEEIIDSLENSGDLRSIIMQLKNQVQNN